MKILLVLAMAVFGMGCGVKQVSFPGGQVSGSADIELVGTTARVEAAGSVEYDLLALICEIPYVGLLIDCGGGDED